MDAPVQEKVVLTGPGLSTAAQVATNVATNLNAQLPDVIATIKPVDVVDRNFVEDIGIKTHGWISEGNTWWRRHQNWVWAFVVGADGIVGWVAPQIPAQYPKLSLTFNMAGVVIGKILSLRMQVSVVIANIRAEVRRHTE